MGGQTVITQDIAGGVAGASKGPYSGPSRALQPPESGSFRTATGSGRWPALVLLKTAMGWKLDREFESHALRKLGSVPVIAGLIAR